MSNIVPHDKPGVSDDESPEWTDEDFLWSVSATDFGGDIMQLHEFLRSGESFLRRANAAGLPKEAFLSLAPQKPGFLDRAASALEAALSATKHAAE